MATSSSIDRRRQRGTAISETLLVFPVALIFMTLLTFVMNFWQDQQIDRSQMLANEIARFNSTSLLWFADIDEKAKGEGTVEPDTGYRPRYCVEEWQSQQPFGQHAKNVFYISLRGKKSYNRRAMFIRGTNVWLSFPFGRSQYKKYFSFPIPQTDEHTRQQEYLKSKQELDRIDKLRKPLQLGS